MTCNITIPESTLTVPTTGIEVVEKFRAISDAALASDSIYMRAKDTFKELLDAKKLSEAEYAQLASQFVSQLAVATTQSAMTVAMQWAVEERESGFKIESLKAQNDLVLAQRERTRFEICKLEKDIALQCATITATSATSIRKNGRVLAMGADGCSVTSLYDEGTEYMQAKAIEGQMYATLADAYRKSGVVTLGTTADGVWKGVSGDNAGYTKGQNDFVIRQIESFEDSKKTHAVNSSAQMIGQLLATEIAPSADFVNQWGASMAYLSGVAWTPKTDLA